MKYIKNTLVFFALIAGLAACSSEHDNLQEYGNYPQDGVVRISSMVTKAFSRASTPYAGNTLDFALNMALVINTIPTWCAGIMSMALGKLPARCCGKTLPIR